MWTLSGFADEIDRDVDVQCEVLRDLGIRHVEFRSAWGTNVLDLSDGQLDTVVAALRHAGLAVSSVGSPVGKVPIAEDFDAHVARFDRALVVAERLAAPYIRLFSFYLPADEEPAKHRDEVLRRMAELVRRAERHDVVLLHENERDIYGDVPQRCLDLVESVGSPKLRLVWDAANYVLCGVRPFTDGYALLRPYLEYVHVKDARRSDGVVTAAGEGDGEIGLTLDAMHSDGFDGFFSLEPHLAGQGRFGGYSGPELFEKATRAFTSLLEERGIPYA